MSPTISKTDYILFRECAKNTWLKIHKPEIFYASELSDFEKSIIETGNEVELVARQLFPSGVLIEGRGEEAQIITQNELLRKTPLLFQPVFIKNGFLAALDVLEHKENDEYYLYEIKATTDVDRKTHFHDLAFQVNLLAMHGITVAKAHVIHLNSEYKRQGEINIHQLFTIADVTEEVFAIKDAVAQEMQVALQYLAQEAEPIGYCQCVYKGRSGQCATFEYSNPKVPAYGVHDISRIGASKKVLQELVDVGIFELQDITEDTIKKMTPAQRNQIIAHVQDTILIDRTSIKAELESLVFPLYFLDYETFPSAIPRFDGFSPYQQIPFQYSLFVLDSPQGKTLRHYEFLYEKDTDPSLEFLQSLEKNIGPVGNIIVWNKKFECGINEQMAERNPSYKDFIASVNARTYDLMEIFGKQYYVHKGFKGRISIKNILPVLVPELSYKTLQIQEGGTASQKWNEAVTVATPAERQTIFTNLKEYCKLDTLAMVKIYEHLLQKIT